MRLILSSCPFFRRICLELFSTIDPSDIKQMEIKVLIGFGMTEKVAGIIKGTFIDPEINFTAILNLGKGNSKGHGAYSP